MDTADREPTNITFFQVEPGHTTSLTSSNSNNDTHQKSLLYKTHVVTHGASQSLNT